MIIYHLLFNRINCKHFSSIYTFVGEHGIHCKMKMKIPEFDDWKIWQKKYYISMRRSIVGNIYVEKWKVFCIFHVMCIQFEWKLKSALNSNIVFPPLFFLFYSRVHLWADNNFQFYLNWKYLWKLNANSIENPNRISKLEKSKTFLIIPNRKFSLLYLSIYLFFVKSLMFHELFINNNNKMFPSEKYRN